MVEFKSLAFRGWYGFRKILNEEQESTVPFSVIYSQTLLSVQEIWKMFPYSKKTIISVETTSPTHRTWVKYTGSRHRKLSFLLVSWSSLPNIVLKSQNSQLLYYLEVFHLAWVTCMKTHSIHLVITTPIMNKASFSPSLKEPPSQAP